MSLRRRSFWPLVAAIPTLVLMMAAGCVLVRFLAMRDRLGTWHLAIHDAHGAAVGQGDLTLVATGWTAQWSWRSPFVQFEPELAVPAGAIHLDPAAFTFMDADATAPVPADYPLLQPAFIGDRLRIAGCADPDADERRLVVLELDLGATPAAAEVEWRHGWSRSGVSNCTTTATR
jgi:hypothetical protein